MEQGRGTFLNQVAVPGAGGQRVWWPLRGREAKQGHLVSGQGVFMTLKNPCGSRVPRIGCRWGGGALPLDPSHSQMPWTGRGVVPSSATRTLSAPLPLPWALSQHGRESTSPFPAIRQRKVGLRDPGSGAVPPSVGCGGGTSWSTLSRTEDFSGFATANQSCRPHRPHRGCGGRQAPGRGQQWVLMPLRALLGRRESQQPLGSAGHGHAAP